MARQCCSWGWSQPKCPMAMLVS
ncbi:MAG: hypothetical protein EB128_12305 [Betaproteobacteria bacterium]|nr:hypothetical protein [Betaproteobacteria bacterium]